mmetsp:Transcript_6931/g.21645  ORF Transcript_6931/g.21645 Transcript_6931/m.21645 type:complete len:93 (-) Transcript_6931:878-1156(-)
MVTVYAQIARLAMDFVQLVQNSAQWLIFVFRDPFLTEPRSSGSTQNYLKWNMFCFISGVTSQPDVIGVSDITRSQWPAFLMLFLLDCLERLT